MRDCTRGKVAGLLEARDGYMPAPGGWGSALPAAQSRPLGSPLIHTKRRRTMPHRKTAVGTLTGCPAPSYPSLKAVARDDRISGDGTSQLRGWRVGALQ